MIRHKFLRLLAVLIVPATSSVAQEKPAGEKRTLTFHRAEVKGAKYEVTAKASVLRTQDYIVDDEREPAEKALNLEIAINGQLEVTNVTPTAGQVNGYTFTVSQVSGTESSKDLTGIKAGSVIKAKPGNGGRTAFAVDGAEPEAVVVEALEAALPPIICVDEETDDLMEPQGPVAPGEEWKPDMARYARAMMKSYLMMEIDVEKSSVKSRFKGPVSIAGQDCDTVIYSDDLKITKIGGLSGGWKLKSGTTSAVTSSAMARDIKIAALVAEKSTRDTEYTYEMKSEGKEYGAVMKSHEQLDRTMKPLK
jgi:hypothetical protein